MEDLEWQQVMDARLARHNEQVPGYRTMWDTVHKRMVRGSERVAVPMTPIPLLHLLAEHGTHLQQTAKYRDGVPNNCHRNSAELWLNGEIDTIGTGFALNDNCWRSHSWGVQGVTIVETTAPREAYWGVEFTKAASLLFSMSETSAGQILQALRDNPDMFVLLTTVEELIGPPEAAGRDVWTNVGAAAITTKPSPDM